MTARGHVDGSTIVSFVDAVERFPLAILVGRNWRPADALIDDIPSRPESACLLFAIRE